MPTNLSFYIVTKDVAVRTGDIDSCYKTADGRYIMDSRLLQRIRLTGEEFMNGLAGVEMITRNEALTLIAKGGYETDADQQPEDEQEQTLQEETPAEETPAGNEEDPGEEQEPVAEEPEEPETEQEPVGEPEPGESEETEEEQKEEEE